MSLKFFTPNLDRSGRMLRAGWGILLLGAAAGAWWGWPSLGWTAAPLLVLAIFAFYEAVRGWCLMRACGIKTKY